MSMEQSADQIDEDAAAGDVRPIVGDDSGERFQVGGGVGHLLGLR